MDIQTAAIAFGLPAFGGLVWLLRLEGRVNTHEAECMQRQKRADERHTELHNQLSDMNNKLDRLVERP